MATKWDRSSYFCSMAWGNELKKYFLKNTMGQFAEFYNLDLINVNIPPDAGHVRLIRNSALPRNPLDPTAPFIAVHDDGYLEPIGGIPAATPFSFQRFEINYSDFQPNAGGTGAILLGTVPAGSMVINAKLKPTIQWDSTTDTSAGMNITLNAPTGSPNAVGFVALDDLGGVMFAPVTDFNGTNSATLSSGTVSNQNNISNIYANLDVDNGTGTIDNLISGQLILWLLTIQGI